MVPNFAQTDRQEIILTAAFTAFATYGFRRTTMDDIARASGLSRTALYLHYRNKEDLFRHMTRAFFDSVNHEVKQILAAPSPNPAATLTAVLRAKDGKVMDVVLGTPHGAELMDAGTSIAGDIAAEGEAAVRAQLSEWIAGRSVPPGLGTPDDIAAALIAAVKGLKSGSPTLAEYRAAQATLASVFGRALTAHRAGV